MTNSPLRILLLSSIVLASFAAPAIAATPAQIHRDAADGSIDGDYTLADMRAADREVSAEQREYFGWDDVYRDHVRQLAMPAPAPARRPARDAATGATPSSRTSNARTGTSTEKSTARSTRKGTRSSVGAKFGDTRASSDSSGSESSGDDEPVTAAAPAADRVRRSGASDSGLPLAWLMAAVPFGIVAIGVWRMRHVRRRAAEDRMAAS